MSWGQAAIELLNSSAFLIGDTSIVELFRTHMALSKRPQQAARTIPAPITESVSKPVKKRRALEELETAFKIERAWQEAKRRGPGIEGLRRTLREQGKDLE